MRHLAILITHPIQYLAPWFRALNARRDLDLEVLICHDARPDEQAEAGFGVAFAWDRPLLEGYPYRFLRNVARRPSIHGFGGLDTPEIKAIVASGAFDAVLVNGWHYKSAWQAIVACRRTGTPVLARGDSHLHSPRHPWKKTVKELLYRQFIPRLDGCLAVGTWSREYFLHYGARPNRVFLVPHSVDETYFERERRRWEERRAELRQRWHAPAGSVLFLFAGKFIAKKRPMDFARAVHRAAQNGAAVAGLMAGDGPLRPEVEAFVRDTGAPVTFAGFLNQSEVPQAYVACDALVLPSDGGETWGLVVNEAMLCHRPCMVSDRVGAGPDLVLPGQTGDVFPLGDVESLARILGRYASQADELTLMGERARERVRLCSLDAAVEGVVRALDAVLSSPRRAPQPYLTGEL